METLSDTTVEIDLSQKTLRELNSELHNPTASSYKVLNPRGGHSVAVGVKDPIDVEIEGDVCYFCAGMHQRGTITSNGMAGSGGAENKRSGVVPVNGHDAHTAAANSAGRPRTT